MSKLPNAPLLEIVLEFRWNVNDKSELSKIQYLYGDLYSELKEKYPFRENIIPAELPIEVLINSPVHRFRRAQNDYPLYQVGPGLLTLNTNDQNYFWHEFSKLSSELLQSFFKVLPFGNNRITPSIIFIDFFPFDFSKDDVNKFINENFKIALNQSFHENSNFAKDLNIGFGYEIHIGDLSITLQKGQNNSLVEGIVLQTRIVGKPLSSELDEITEWVEKAHEICSDLFKKLTSGTLYESFKS